MNHCYNIEIAVKIGQNEAVILENIVYWVNKNKDNKKNFFDGCYWTYNSFTAFQEIFPYWTTRQIRRIIASLKKQNLIKTGNYNEKPYDRTTWYTLTEYAQSMYSNSHMDMTKSEQGREQGSEQTAQTFVETAQACTKKAQACTKRAMVGDEMVSPIPDINTDINTDKEKINKKEKVQNLDFELIDNYEDLFDFWAFHKNGNKYKTKQSKGIAYKKLLNMSKHNFIEAKQIVENSISNGWAGLFPLKTNDNGLNRQNKPVKYSSWADFNKRENESDYETLEVDNSNSFLQIGREVRK